MWRRQSAIQWVGNASSDALAQLRSDFNGARRTNARPEGPYSASIEYSNNKSILFEMESDPPHRFVRIGPIGGPKEASTGTVSTLAELHRKLQADEAAETFSGVVLVAKDGKPIFHNAYGYADKKAGRRNREDTKFNLGSINKMFTKVAILQLLDAGKLNLTDTIDKYLPQFPSEVASKVTVKHLLDHRSGWGAYWDNPVWNEKRAELRSLDDYIAFIKDIPLDFEPGSKMQYSNTGYEVLGAIVQRASGQSYYDYVRDHIYTPAGMSNSDAFERDGDTPNMAIGYADGGYTTDNLSMLSPKGTAAGGGMSTAEDMLRFTRALQEGILVSSKHANQFRFGGVAGGGPGVNAILEMGAPDDHTIVVLSNFSPPTAGKVSELIRDILRGTPGAKKHRIGVGFGVTDDGISVNFLVPNAPGERGGLKPDDMILAINGTPVSDDPISQLDKALVTADPITLKIRRDSEVKTVTLIPEAIDGNTP